MYADIYTYTCIDVPRPAYMSTVICIYTYICTHIPTPSTHILNVCLHIRTGGYV